ncbi:hypothetical protein [Mycolicibacterium sp. HS_4_1]
MTASVNPISEWAQVLTTTFNNISALGQQVWADPAPILKQILINQLGYANTIATDLGAAGNGFVTAVTALPQAFQQAAQQLAAGQISAGINTAWGAVLNLVVNPGFALLQGQTLNIPGKVMQNVANVAKLLPDLIVGIGFSVLGTVGGVESAFADTAQAVYDGVRAGNVGAALNAIVNAPAVLTNAFLNGYGPTGFGGLLAPGSGVVPILVIAVRDAIAQALGAPVPAAAAAASPAPVAAKVADAGPSAVPSAALSAATVTLGAEKVTTPDTAKTAATKTAAAEPAAAAPVATGPAAGSPATASPETPSTATEPKPESGATSGGTTTPTSGTGTTGEPTKPSGSTGSETGSGSTTTPNAGTGTTGGTKTGTTGEPTKPTKPSGSTGSETGSGSTTTPNDGTGSTGGTKTGKPGKTGEPKKPTKPTKPSGSAASGTGSGSTGSGSGGSHAAA